MGLTTTREFRWDDAGAPVLNGIAGSFYDLVKACLVGTSGVAYGSGAGTRMAAGWTLEFDDPVNFKAVFRNSLAAGGTGCYLRVHDNGSFTGGGRVARIAMYESMSDIDTGTGLAVDGWIWKALTATSTARAYTLHADERQWFCTTYTLNATPPVMNAGRYAQDYCCAVGGGDYVAFIPGDTGCWGAVTNLENPSTGSDSKVESGLLKGNSDASGSSNWFRVSRDKDLAGSPTNAALITANSTSGSSIGGRAPIGNPSPGYLGVHMIPALVVAAGTIRGRLRGLYVPLNTWGAGGAHVGTKHTPMNTVAALELAALAGTGSPDFTNNGVGRVFVESDLSWDAV